MSENQIQFFYFIYFVFTIYMLYTISTYLKNKCCKDDDDDDDDDFNIEDLINDDLNETNEIVDPDIDLSQYTQKEIKNIKKYGHFKPDASSSSEEDNV